MSDNAQNPPRGDFQQAEKYINQLVDLISRNKIEVSHTDLKKFDPTTLQDHYTVNLSTYHIEISHSKQPNSDKDSHVMIFNNLKHLAEGTGDKVILAYIYLAESQFSRFKAAADRQIYDRERALEEKRFNQAVEPIDQLLNQAQGPMHDFKSEPAKTHTFGEQKELPEKLSDYNSSQIHQI